MMRKILAVLALLLWAFQAQAQALGAVMMHGKWGTPPYWHDGVSRALEAEGWPVIELVMPWAGNRLYDAPYSSALQQIAAAVAELRARGVKRVIVGGHSFGANAAIAYAGAGGDTDGILAMAPGHSPRVAYYRGGTRSAVEEARQLVAAGKGGDTLSFNDPNQDKLRRLTARADVFLSYFDPEGIGDMPTSAARIQKPIPLLWLIGTADPLYGPGRAYVFDKVPAHPLSRYEVVQATHASTPGAGISKILDWAKAIAAQP